jgi:succinyl-diaminopimelate desuccinylase
MAKIICEIDKLETLEKERLGKHDLLGWPSITPTILMGPVHGEAQINVVPDQCMTTLDIRTIPGQEHKVIKSQLQNIIDKLAKDDPEFKAEIEVIEERPWTITDRDNPVVTAVAKAAQIVTGKEAVYNGVPGATDGTFLHMAGIPIVTIGAGERDVPHQINEYVDVEELAETTEIYRTAALIFLNEESSY